MAIFISWDLADAISVKSCQKLMGMLEVCRHGGVLGAEVLVDLMNNELSVTEYLDLFSAHLFGKGVKFEAEVVLEDDFILGDKDEVRPTTLGIGGTIDIQCPQGLAEVKVAVAGNVNKG
ncbi:unnamed protein product [Prunus armeniaca]